MHGEINYGFSPRRQTVSKLGHDCITRLSGNPLEKSRSVGHNTRTMQPHSMAALSLAGFVWNNPYKVVKSSARAEVEYRKRADELKTNYYDLSGITLSSDKRTLTVTIGRVIKGAPCTITIRRNTDDVPCKVTMSHSQQHAADLREEFRLTPSQIQDGRHYNSYIYREFRGKFTVDDCSRSDLSCEVRNRELRYVWVNYKTKVDFL